MADPVTIPPGPPAQKGLDFAALKAEGIALVQRLAGEIWTDFNEHDPGVTTLEQLCYALTELSYRAEFPLADLLADRRGGKIDTRRQALFIPRRILPCNPTTEDDYRKLIVDRVPGVANAWLRPHRPRDPAKFVNGLYDIALYAPGVDPCACDGELAPRALRRRARRIYCRHRDLCEDVHGVHVLKPLRAAVYAAAVIESARAPEAILAALFFNLGNFLAPELRRRPLKSLLDAGLTPDEIFLGPLLRNGFISGEQLQPKAAQIPVQEIVRVMAGSEGVASVRDVSVRVGDGGTIYRGNDSIPVPDESILRLDTGMGRQRGNFTVRLFKDGLEYEPDPLLVRRELDRLWADYRTTYRLAPEYEEYLAVPRGQHRNVEAYYSIQNQYPDVYGISDYGLPEAAPPRRGQAKQLKGYLLVFEQLLADFFAQLAHVKDLFSTEAGLRQTYFYQYLTESVPNVAPLLKDDYRRGLPLIVRDADRFAERRNRFLDLLLALYAEELGASSIAGSTRAGAGEHGEAGRLMRAKLALLRRLVASTHNRGRGFDYLARASPRNTAGMEIKCRIQLGMDALEQRPLVDVLEASAVALVAEEAATAGRPLARHDDDIEEHFAPIAPLTHDPDLPADERAAARVEPHASSVTPLRGQSVSEGFLRAAADVENYRTGSFTGENAVAVVCKARGESRWRLVGKYPDRDAASAAARAAAASARALYRQRRQLYIVEHTLLRFGRSTHDSQPTDYDAATRRDPRGQTSDAQGGGREFGYSFTITAVVSASPDAEGDAEHRAFVREVIRQNTPAHVVADYCFLDLRRMIEFELLYWDWRRALRRGWPRQNVIETSARLRNFLRRCRRPDGRGDV